MADHVEILTACMQNGQWPLVTMHPWLPYPYWPGACGTARDAPLDLIRAPYCYVLYGVKYIDPVSLGAPVPAPVRHLCPPIFQLLNPQAEKPLTYGAFVP